MANSVEVEKKKKLNISGYSVKLPVRVLIFKEGHTCKQSSKGSQGSKMVLCRTAIAM